MPGWRDWVFALKTFAAAIIALYLAMLLDLPRPYWALGTVYITSQVLAGATRSKAFYRVCGTVLGAAVSVVLVPNLVNAPVLLSLAIAAWVGFCLYFSLLDRTPRSYLLMLAGYSAAIVGFPSVNAPEAIFDTAVARVQEITLGILCASAISTLVFPQSVLPLISDRLDGWIRSARGWVCDILERNSAATDTQAERLRLASDAIAFDALTTPLHYEAATPAGSANAMLILRQHMLMFLPIASAMSGRISVLEHSGALDLRLRILFQDVSTWLRCEITEHARAQHLRDTAERLEPDLGKNSNWHDLVLANLLARLRDFIDLRQDVRLLQQFLRDGRPPETPFAFSYTANAQSIRHRDHGMALLSAIGAFLAVVVTCAIWIASGWPDGSAAPMMAAVTCSLFAAYDDPAPFIISFANAAIVGAVCAGLYLFAVLPLASNFEMLALALAPWLIVCGVFMAQPRTAPFATGVAVNGATMIAIQNGPLDDFAPFANSAIAVIVGMWCAALIVRLVRSVGGAWSARRLRRINRESLANSATHGGSGHGLELAALMLDRVGLMAPRLAALPPEDAEWTDDLLAEVRSGINIIELRRVRAAVPAGAENAIEMVLASTARYLRSPSERAGPELLEFIDRAIGTLLNCESTPDQREALHGLVGLRLGLFANAPAFRGAGVAATEAEPG
ncbi:MAG: FUSC family protein [Rhodomicrobium sp.]